MGQLELEMLLFENMGKCESDALLENMGEYRCPTDAIIGHVQIFIILYCETI